MMLYCYFLVLLLLLLFLYLMLTCQSVYSPPKNTFLFKEFVFIEKLFFHHSLMVLMQKCVLLDVKHNVCAHRCSRRSSSSSLMLLMMVIKFNKSIIFDRKPLNLATNIIISSIIIWKGGDLRKKNIFPIWCWLRWCCSWSVGWCLALSMDGRADIHINVYLPQWCTNECFVVFRCLLADVFFFFFFFVW